MHNRELNKVTDLNEAIVHDDEFEKKAEEELWEDLGEELDEELGEPIEKDPYIVEQLQKIVNVTNAIKQTVDINSLNSLGNTALHECILSIHDSCKYIQLKSNENKDVNYNPTTIQIIGEQILCNNIPIILRLVNAGCDIMIKNNEQLIAIDYLKQLAGVFIDKNSIEAVCDMIEITYRKRHPLQYLKDAAINDNTPKEPEHYII